MGNLGAKKEHWPLTQWPMVSVRDEMQTGDVRASLESLTSISPQDMQTLGNTKLHHNPGEPNESVL